MLSSPQYNQVEHNQLQLLVFAVIGGYYIKMLSFLPQYIAYMDQSVSGHLGRQLPHQ